MPADKPLHNQQSERLERTSSEFARELRRIVLRESRRANVGHIGSSLSIADVVAVLFNEVLRLDGSVNNRDRFILSKGHAALALYSALHLRGAIGEKEICEYCADDTLLGVHPEHALAGVDFCTGSLGHGLSIGAGAALAARLQKSERKVYVLLSDAECNEGSVWEAAMFAAHHKLANLVAIVDLNGQQAFGYTRDVLHPSPMEERWRAFGWNVHDVNGHDSAQLASVFHNMECASGAPNLVLARTTFGKGVSYMESQIKWHYWPMSDDDYSLALSEIGG